MDKMTFNSVEKGIIQLRKTKEEITDACKKGSSKRSNAPVPQNSIIGALLCFLCIMKNADAVTKISVSLSMFGDWFIFLKS